MYWGAAAAGLFVVAAIGYAAGIGTAWRERKMLLEAMAGTLPADGRWAAVSGTIQALSPLTAPLSRERVVAYEYRIHRSERLGKSDSDITYYEGKALAPSTIATRHGTVRLLCFPSFDDIEAESFAPSEALERARDYVAETTFTIFETSKKNGGSASRRSGRTTTVNTASTAGTTRAKSTSPTASNSRRNTSGRGNRSAHSAFTPGSAAA